MFHEIYRIFLPRTLRYLGGILFANLSREGQKEGRDRITRMKNGGQGFRATLWEKLETRRVPLAALRHDIDSRRAKEEREGGYVRRENTRGKQTLGGTVEISVVIRARFPTRGFYVALPRSRSSSKFERLSLSLLRPFDRRKYKVCEV